MVTAKRKKWSWYVKGKGVAKGKTPRWEVNKQKLTYHLRKTDGSGHFDGRDNDTKFPKGTIGTRDKTQVQQNQFGWVGGRRPATRYKAFDEKGKVIGYYKRRR